MATVCNRVAGLVVVAMLQLALPRSAGAMPNPASMHCGSAGGTLETRTNEYGEYGVCLFPDGCECEEWAFFNGEVCQDHSLCAQQGGAIVVHTGEDCPQELLVTTCGVCELPSGGQSFESDLDRGGCSVSGGTLPASSGLCLALLLLVLARRRKVRVTA
jgi:uncharacterized protein